MSDVSDHELGGGWDEPARKKIKPRCETCGGRRFELGEGSILVCADCGAQKQDYVEEIGDDGMIELAGRGFRRHTKKDPRVKVVIDKSGRQKPVYDKWDLQFEAVQTALRAQVDALIALGVCPKLKDVVRTIWFAYVEWSHDGLTKEQLKGNTGAQNNDDFKVVVSSDSYSDTDSEPEDASNPNKRTKTESAPENLYEEVEQRKKSAAGRPRKDGKTTGETRVGPVLGYSGHYGLYRDRVMMRYTLPILALACHWLREPVLIHDLIRWARNGQLPYWDAYKLHGGAKDFPMVYLNDLRPQEIPSVAAIYRVMVKFLPIVRLANEDVPPLNVPLIAHRYLHELALPQHLSPLCEYLLHRSGLSLAPGYYRHWEWHVGNRHKMMPHVVLMGLLVVALKLTCDLHELDTTNRPEEQLQAAAESTDTQEGAFVWRRWAATAWERLAERKKKDIPTSKSELALVEEHEQYLEFLSGHVFNANIMNKCEPIANVFKKVSENDVFQHDQQEAERGVPQQPRAHSSQSQPQPGGVLALMGASPRVSHNQGVVGVQMARGAPEGERVSTLSVFAAGSSSHGSGKNEARSQKYEELLHHWSGVSTQRELEYTRTQPPHQRYVRYAEQFGRKNMSYHPNYRLLTAICAASIEVPPDTLRKAIEEIEKRLFDKQ